MDSFFANASFWPAFDQEHVRAERVLPSDCFPSTTHSQRGDFDLSINLGGVHGHDHMPVLNPIMHQDLVFGQFDQGYGD